MVVFQMIPILTLLAYFLYLTYYYAAPMFWLRVLMLIAYKKYHCTEVRFTEETISIRLLRDGAETVLEQPLGVELESRFFVMTACSVVRKLLRDLRKEKAYPEE